MDIAVNLGFVLPIRVRIFLQHVPVGDDVLQMRLPSMSPLVRRQPIQHSLIRSPLCLDVERCVNFQSAFMNLVSSVLTLEVAPNLLDNIGRERIGVMRKMEYERGEARIGRLCRCNLSVFEHGIDNQVAPPERAVGMVDWRVIRRPLGEPSDQRSFLNSKLLSRLAEVELRRRLESVHSVVEKNLIRIQPENLRLGETALDLNGTHCFSHFARKRAVRRKKKIPRQLHGQSRGALNLPTRLNIAICRAHNAPEVDS